MRGRSAESPSEIPLRGWWDITKRVYKSFQANQIQLVSAGIAFFSLLSLFPSIAAAVSIWGIFADPQRISETIERFSDLLPSEAFQIIQSQASQLAGSPRQSLGLGFFISTLLALFGASRSVKGFISAINSIYQEKEKRNFIVLAIFAVFLTLGLLIVLLVMVAAIVVSPNLLAWLGIDETYMPFYQIVRWAFLIIFATFAISILYRFGPSRKAARWRWITGGSLFATVLWIGISAVFSFYVSHFASYNETYGSLGAVIILLMWMWLSSMVILLGAIIDAETELQTEKDSTIGPEKPMGERGAYVADNVASK
jgi:membrane protein